jgi:uncharacterized protein YecA (UPF0149 family)
MVGLLAAMEGTGHTQSPEPPADAQNCTTMPNEPGFHMHNSAQKPEPYRRPEPKTGRNDMCPCGSNKKYKHCCLNRSSVAAA